MAGHAQINRALSRAGSLCRCITIVTKSSSGLEGRVRGQRKRKT